MKQGQNDRLVRFDSKVTYGMPLDRNHQKYLTNKVYKGPVFISNYPKKLKPFYAKLNADNKTVAAMDFFVPTIGEVASGSERESRLKELDTRMEEQGLDKKAYWWYRDLRKYGSAPHSGFSVGIERLILWITGFKDVRDVIPFPRNKGDINY